MTATATRLSASIAVAFAIVLGVLWRLGGGDPPPLTPHIAVAPGAQRAPRAQATVYDTTESPQEAADSAIENTVGPEGVRPDLTPLRPAVFRRPIARYRVYAVSRAHTLARQLGALTSALRAGDRAAARRHWLAAYGTYLRIGAAYGALGDLDAAIEGHGRGLHAIERGLWTGASPAALLPVAQAVRRAVAHLPRALRAGPITPLDYATRAHEILEDDQRDQLSLAAPRWSGAAVLATAAGLAATREVVGTLDGVLSGRGDVLGQVRFRLDELGGVLTSIRRAHGGSPPLRRLTRAEHERLTATLGAALEALAGVPGALETAVPPAIPRIR